MAYSAMKLCHFRATLNQTSTSAVAEKACHASVQSLVMWNMTEVFKVIVISRRKYLVSRALKSSFKGLETRCQGLGLKIWCQGRAWSSSPVKGIGLRPSRPDTMARLWEIYMYCCIQK